MASDLKYLLSDVIVRANNPNITKKGNVCVYLKESLTIQKSLCFLL